MRAMLGRRASKFPCCPPGSAPIADGPSEVSVVFVLISFKFARACERPPYILLLSALQSSADHFALMASGTWTGTGRWLGQHRTMKNRPGSQAATGLFPTHHRQWRLHTQAHSTSHTAQADPHTDVRSRAFGSTRLRRRRVDPAPLEGPHSTALLEAPTEEALAQQLAQQLQPHRLATVLNQLLPAAQLRWQSSFSLGAVEATVAPLLPKLLLLLTAVLWGSYAPSLRLLYSSPAPPDPLVVMAVRTVLQTALLVLFAKATAEEKSAPEGHTAMGSATGGGAAAAAEQAGGGGLLSWLSQLPPSLWQGALEIGLLNYLASASQTVGVQMVSATRAGFLIQAKSLFTPLLSTLAGYTPTSQVWAGCGLALAGTLLIASDLPGATAGGMQLGGLQLGGDTVVLLSALFYSLTIVRTPVYAKGTPAADLAAGKSLVMAGLGLAAAAASAAAQGQPLESLWPGYGDPASWGVLAWLAVGPGALAAFCQVQGLKDVPPADAQVIFSSVPLWSAGFAWALLGGEQLGPITWVGGAAIVAAGLLAATAPHMETEQQQQQPQQQQLKGSTPSSG